MNFTITRNPDARVIDLIVSNHVTISPKAGGSTPYPDCKVTIQRRTLNNTGFTNLTEVDYVNQSHISYGYGYKSAAAKYSDTSIDPQTTYVYRASHLYKEQQFFTSEFEVLAKYRDETSISPSLMKRVEFVWNDTWIPKNGDVYKFELERQVYGGTYKKITDLDISTKGRHRLSHGQRIQTDPFLSHKMHMHIVRNPSPHRRHLLLHSFHYQTQ
jgi:hypothetical protein